MFVCTNCGTEVGPGQAFCPKCGKDVVDNYEAICPKCKAHNAGGSAFCMKCGAAVPVLRRPICPHCGKDNMPGTKFCRFCGGKIDVLAETHSQEQVDEDLLAKENAALYEERRIQKLENELYERVDRFEDYKDKYSRFDTEDLKKLKQASAAVKAENEFLADPYANASEEETAASAYVCPFCGKVNGRESDKCSRCGRSKSKTARLAAKKRIPSFKDAKRFDMDKMLAKPEEPEYMEEPTLDLSLEDYNNPVDDLPPIEEVTAAEEVAEEVAPVKKEKYEEVAEEEEEVPEYVEPYYHPYPAQPYAGPGYVPGSFEPYQMPPIVQPITFVPFVSTDQPLWQIPSPDEELAREMMNKNNG